MKRSLLILTVDNKVLGLLSDNKHLKKSNFVLRISWYLFLFSSKQPRVLLNKGITDMVIKKVTG